MKSKIATSHEEEKKMIEKVEELFNQIEQLFIHFNSSKIFSTSKEFSLPELRVLRYVKDTKKCHMKEIIDNLALAPSTTTGIVDRLVKNGYVRRIVSDEDRRKVFIEITPEGIEVQEEMRTQALLEMGRTMNGFTEEDMNQMITLLAKITYRLKEK